VTLFCIDLARQAFPSFIINKFHNPSPFILLFIYLILVPINIETSTVLLLLIFMMYKCKQYNHKCFLRLPLVITVR